MRTSRQDAVWRKRRFSERAKLFDRRCLATVIHAFPKSRCRKYRDGSSAPRGLTSNGTGAIAGRSSGGIRRGFDRANNFCKGETEQQPADSAINKCNT